MGITFSEGSGLNDSIFGKSQAPIRLFLEKRGESFEQKSLIKDLFQMGKSNHFGEKLTGMTAMDGFQPVGENGVTPKDEFQEGYSKFFEHMTWKDSFSVSREMVEDSKIIDFKKKPSAFITGYHRTREKFAAAAFGNATQGNTSMTYLGKSFDLSGADGLSIFSTAHTAKVKGDAQSNCYSDAFSAETLGAMETAMQLFKGDNEEILDVAPDTIVIPNIYSLKNDVFAAIGADKDPATANNAFNYQFGRWNVICWPYLNQFMGSTNSAPWLLLDSRYNDEYGGAVWLDRTQLEVDSHIDRNTHANVWSGYARFVAGFNDWRFACAGGIDGGDSL